MLLLLLSLSLLFSFFPEFVDGCHCEWDIRVKDAMYSKNK